MKPRKRLTANPTLWYEHRIWNGGDDMQMDMPEPGDMCCCCWEEHDLAIAQRALEKMTGPHASANHIIISDLSLTQAF